jgi:putative membrane protein
MRLLICSAALMLASSASAQTPSAADYVRMAGQSDAFEIQSGQLAASKATSADLKAFGARMVKDHTKSTQTVLAAAAKSGLSPAAPPPLPPAKSDMLTQLQAANGEAFDRLYVSQQLQAHQEALSLQSGYARSGQDPNLKAAAAKIVPVVTMHLDMLRKGGGGHGM